MAGKLVSPLDRSSERAGDMLPETPWQILVSSPTHFSRKCADSSLKLFVALMNLNSPGTTWWPHLGTDSKCRHRHLAALREGGQEEGEGGTPFLV